MGRFARVCRTVKGPRGARLGAIGARTGAFQTMRYSEKLLQAGGVTVVTVDLCEMMGAASRVSDADGDLLAKLDKIKAYGRIPAHGVCSASCAGQSACALGRGGGPRAALGGLAAQYGRSWAAPPHSALGLGRRILVWLCPTLAQQADEDRGR